MRVGARPGLVRVSSRSWALQPARGGVRRRLGDIILFAFLSGSCCLFLIYRWLWVLIPVSSVVVGREPFTCFEN